MTDDDSLHRPLLSLMNELSHRGGRRESNPSMVEQEAVGAEPDGLQVVVHNAASSAPPAEPWYANPLQLTAMISNFSTSYNVFNIAIVLAILEQLFPSTSEADKAAVASSLLLGMIVGQLLGGALGDSRLGRLGALRLVMLLQIIAAIGSATCTGADLYLQLASWRLVLGIGAGGVYPLAAVLSAEQGGQNKSADESLHRVVLTFSMQGVGFLSVPLVAVPLLYTVGNLQVIWRILVGLGCLPGLVLMVLQWHIYRREQSGGLREVLSTEDVVVDDSDGETGSVLDSEAEAAPEGDGLFQDIDNEPVTRHRHGWWASIRQESDLLRKLLGTAATWFLFDVLFYGNTLFQPIVIEAAFGARKGETPLDILQQTALHSLLLQSIALPGYAVAGLALGSTVFGLHLTPRFVMMQGFASMAVLYLVIGVTWSELRHVPALLVVLYGLTFFFANFGPNTTTFVLPSLIYSEECRSTLNGISAAAGKLGAWTGATLFAPAADSIGDAAIMMVCAAIAVVALIMTKFFVRLREDSHEL